MTRPPDTFRAIVAVGLLAALIGAGACGDDSTETHASADRFDAERAFADLEAQVALGPRPAESAANRRAAELISGALRAAGAEEVTIQRPWRNVVATIPGSEPGAILLAAHFDTKDIPGFVGANDGASGVAVVLELARVLGAERNGGGELAGPSVALALFDAEEARGSRPFEVDGTRGSRQYVEIARRGGSAGVPPIRRIESMILFDLVGDCDLSIPHEAGSDRALYDRIADAAREVDGSAAPFEGETAAVLDDHVPFLEAGVPAVDLIDFEFGPGPSPGAWWHTNEDTLDKVCASSLDAVGEAVLRVLPATL